MDPLRAGGWYVSITLSLVPMLCRKASSLAAACGSSRVCAALRHATAQAGARILAELLFSYISLYRITIWSLAALARSESSTWSRYTWNFCAGG